MPGVRGSVRAVDAVRGSVWTIGGYGAGQVLRFAATLVLARHLLDPQAFGLVALTNVFLGGLELLFDFGIGTDVIQHRRGDEPSFINTAFSVQLIRGSILFAAALALAPVFANFYGQPAVRALAMVAALSVAIRGVASSSVWTMTRHLQLGKLTVLSFTSDLAGFVVSVGWALVSPTAWALVVGKVASTLCYTVGSHLMAEHPLGLQWERSAVRDILTFGAGMLLSSATYFLGGEAERLVIGKFITVAELGCFSLALTLASAPSMIFQKIAAQVFLPMIARSKREATNTLAKDYKRARFLFSCLSLIVGGGFIAYSHRLVGFLLPPKYAMTGWMLQLLGFRAAEEIFAAPATNLILACGASIYAAIGNIVRLVLMVTGVWYAFSHSGLHLAIGVLAIVPAISYLVFLFGIKRLLRRALWSEIAMFVGFIVLMLCAAVIPWPFA
jgi:O-antigen/teichoic acid export membrane protein